MPALWTVLTVVLGTWPAEALIFHLNESEYQRMPPLFGLDDYQVCLSEPGGLYCLARLDLYAEPDNQLMLMIQEYSAVVSKHYNHTALDRGICVRRTCADYVGNRTLNRTELEEAISACLNHEIQRQYGLKAHLSRLYYCDGPGGSTIDNADVLDWCVAGICAAFVTASILGTLYDYVLNFYHEDEKQRGNKYLLSFSAIRNWQWLVTADHSDPRLERLKGFHGARSITNVLIVFGHSISLMGAGFIDSPHTFENTYEQTPYRIIYNGLTIVQVFFVMSGFLFVYNYLIRTEKTKASWKAIPVVMLIRWWRLTPSYAMMVAFTATWLRFLGTGPLWNLYVTSGVVADCRTYWWHHLLFIHNYFPNDKFCAVQSWHIAVDTQLFFVGLLVYVLTRKVARQVMLGILLVLGIVLPALQVWFYDLDGMMLLAPEFLRTMESDTFHYLHVYGHTNLAGYVVGMICGELIYRWQTDGHKITHSLYAKGLWLVVPAIIALLYSGQGFYADGERASVPVRMVYASTNRLVLALIAAFGFIGVVMKSKTILRHLMEWRGWLVPSRLSYSVFLLHFNFIFLLLGLKTSMSPVSYYYMALWHLGITALSYIVAVPFFLLVEAPLNRLMKNILTNFSHLSSNGEVQLPKQEKTQFSRC
ncbi:nose resistant to fluoxetine protein 6 [Manduca sexta]|uniref:nose resistant to fluoxetine protein 6 n=1 Tax=Manduca sexta TaxID=7130 RepID=UPI00188FC336|nr:nose resistant to fluoxetine protein 6 [Manduca sexta]